MAGAASDAIGEDSHMGVDEQYHRMLYSLYID